MRLQGKTAIITGAASGIGEAMAQAFVREGARVVLGDLDGGRVQALAAQLGDGAAIGVRVDVTDKAAVDAMVRDALSAFPAVDILVNNAGARIIKSFTQHTLEDWRRMIDINLTGPFLCSQAVAPHMLARRAGSIIHIASIASFMGRPGRVAYVAAKTGLLGLTRAMTVDFTGTGVRVNAIAPGMIATPFNAMFSESAETGPVWAKENAVGRWGKPDDIANAAVFLASDESAFICGAEIKVDGGWLASKTRSGELG